MALPKAANQAVVRIVGREISKRGRTGKQLLNDLPVDTGRLRSSYRVDYRRSQRRVRVYFKARYWYYQTTKSGRPLPEALRYYLKLAARRTLPATAAVLVGLGLDELAEALKELRGGSFFVVTVPRFSFPGGGGGGGGGYVEAEVDEDVLAGTLTRR